MVENSDENDPFEEDIVFDQTGLLGNKSRQQYSTGVLPTFMLFIRTVFLCIAFISLGLCSSVSIGPLIHLELAVGLPLEKAFHAFTANSIGMLCGGVLGSVLFEIYNRQFLIFISLLWMSVSIAVLPFTIPYSFWWTLMTLVALGAGMSFIFTGSNVLCLDLWGKQGGASLQCLHFSFAVGAFIAPIVVHPFLMGPQSSAEVLGIPSSISTVSPLVSPQMVRNIRSINDSYSTFTAVQQGTSPMPLLFSSVNGVRVDNSSLAQISIAGDLTKLTLPLSTSDSSNSSSISDSDSLRNNSLVKINSEVLNISQIDTTSKAKNNPKPKPSFTNANLIPEDSKWKRPPIKLLKDQKNKLENTTSQSSKKINELDPKKIAQVTSTTTDVESPTIASEDTSISKSVTTLESVTSHMDSLSHSSEHAVNINASSDSNFATTLQEDALSTESYQKTILLSSSYPSTVNSLLTNSSTANSQNNKEELNVSKIVTPSTPVLTTIMQNESIKTDQNSSILRHISSNSTTSKPNKINNTKTENSYNIDFSHNSDYDYSENESRYSSSGVDFPDYTDSKVKSLITEPEVLDLKEYPYEEPLAGDHQGSSSTSDDEASTISVTASFPDSSVTRHSSHQAKPGTFSNASIIDSHFLKSIADKFKNYGVTNVHLIYIGVGIFVLLNAFVAVIIMCHNPREPKSKQDESTLDQMQKRRMKIFMLIFAIYMFTAEALQGSVHHLLASSNTRNGIPVASKSIDGQAIFWGLVCAMRFICILASGCLKVKPGKILVASTLFMVLGTIFLCIGTFDKKDFLWGGIVVVALGLAPVLPTCFLWMAEHMRVTHTMCALMIVLSSLGNSLTHLTLTYVKANSHLYSYILLSISSASLFFLLVSFCLLYRNQSSKSSLGVPIGYHLANQEEDENIELTRPNVKNFDNMNRRLSEMGEVGQALLID